MVQHVRQNSDDDDDDTTTTTNNNNDNNENDEATHHPCIAPPGLLIVKSTAHAGRGVFATQAIRAGTLIDVSHALLFPAREYQQHGRHTQLDQYTYVWAKTSEGAVMALALGLGSLFNHAYDAPNVSYTLHKPSQTIRYVVARNVEPGEQLCISYGCGRMWWEQSDDDDSREENGKRDNGLSD